MEREEYQGAYVQVDITPEYPVTLIGRYRPNPSEGILHRLYGQMLLFGHGNEIFCLVAVDSLGLTVSLSEKLRMEVAGILHTEISHVMLNFSHTHSAPDPTTYGLNGEKYFRFLCQRIVACARKAQQKLRPCRIGWAMGTAGIGENRREGGSALDSRLGALLVTDAEEGLPMAMVIRIAAHPNILPARNLYVSSDFVGVARDVLQKCYGFPFLFLQGASGNIKAKGTNRVGEGDDQVFQKVTDSLVESVRDLRFQLRNITDIQMFSREITCIADMPTRDEISRMTEGYQSPAAENWKKACEDFRIKGITHQKFQVEVNFLKINEGCFCGVPEELFCEPALDVQERTQNPFLFLNGYTNGCSGYVPSYEEWFKGGYEVWHSYFEFYEYSGRMMPYRAETADAIADVAVNEWSRLICGRNEKL